MGDGDGLISVKELTDACQVEAKAARKLARELTELAVLLEHGGDVPESEQLQLTEIDVSCCLRIFRTAMAHRRAVYDA